LGGKLYPRSV